MDGAFDIPDATDWISTPLKDFSTLENALHCQICKEFYDTPMLTSCCHTFCSKCIRTCLSTDGRCPACRATDQASKLRNNWALQEIVATFQAARPAALEVARKAQQEAEESKNPGKRKRAVVDTEDAAQAQRNSRSTRSKSRRIAASQTSEPEIIEVGDSDGDEDFEPEVIPEDGLVECPLGCGKRMKIEAVDPHLDRCEDERNQASRAKSRTPVNVFGGSRPTSAQLGKPQDRISELNYSLLNETKLKKKLDELNIPNWGSKPLLIRRHTEWVNLWNANCDSNHPRTKRELLLELDVWERTQGGKAPGVSSLASNVMRKDFDGVGWVNKNKNDFSRLIAEAKRKKHNPSLEVDRSKSQDANDIGSANTSNDVDTANDETSSHEQSEPAKPHENNTEAVQAVREKVDAINNAQDTAPAPNGASISQASAANSAETNNSPALQRTHFGLPSEYVHKVDGEHSLPCDLPTHFHSHSLKKVPMFAAPQQAVTDLDDGGGG